MARPSAMSGRLLAFYVQTRKAVNSRPLSDFVPLRPSQGRLMYVCPVCGSGTGKNKTGALRLYPPRGKEDGWRAICFSGGCFGPKGTDTLGALKILHPGKSEWRIFQDAGYVYQKAPETPGGDPAPSLEDFIRRARAQLSGSPGERYLKARGLTDETLSSFRLGFVSGHYFPAAGRRMDAVVIPYPDAAYWVARGMEDKAFDKPRASLFGPEPLFNAGVLSRERTGVFVVESQLCALSLAQLGFSAVALGNSGGGRLLEKLRETPCQAALILALDNDPQEEGQPLSKGPRAQRDLLLALEKEGRRALEWNVAGEYKDPNEALQKDEAGLKKRALEALAAAARLGSGQERPDTREQDGYASLNAGGMLEKLQRDMAAGGLYAAVSTGFPGLDRLLGGGFYPGLYVLGAATSLGKTSFALQLGDQIAAQGRDVLFFTLEMSPYELMAKSVSRLTFRRGKAARATLDILSSARYAAAAPQEREAVRDAFAQYAPLARRIWFVEGAGDVSARAVAARVKKHMEATGRVPVVIIDYLQILSPLDSRGTDKQNTDRNLLELKRLSRDCSAVVIGISSLNRENYFQPIGMTAYKETGAIEYGSDCLLGFQYDGMDYQDGETDKARDKRVRDLAEENARRAAGGEAVRMQIKVLKARNGARGACCLLNYTPKYNDFQEAAPRDPFSGVKSVPLKGKR